MTERATVMNLILRPDIIQFIDEQVKAGRFPSPEAVVEAAIVEWREADEEELDDETIAAINEAEEQGDRGEGIEFDALRAELKSRLHGNR
jgi:Arc/MetJ-type ribon-helix-helix transcriptional regulator